MWKLAWRQLIRHRARTLITGTAIALAFAFFLITLGLTDGMYERMVEAAERTAGGSVLVHGEGYWESQASDDVVADPDALVAAALATPGVREATPRVLVNGLIRSADGAAGLRLQGIIPAREEALHQLDRNLREGTFLGGDDPLAIVLGRRTVEDLRVDLGDRIVLTATDIHGEPVQALFRLGGVLESGSAALDQGAAYVHLAALQRALGYEAAVNQVGLVLEAGATAREVRASLLERLGGAAAGLELLTWEEALPEMVAYIEVDSRFNYLLSFIIFIVVAFGIANTFLMSVLERVRELGLLSALGLTPGRVGGMVVRESLLLALLAATIGLAFGLGAHAWLSTVGLDWSELMSGDTELAGVVFDDLVIHSKLVPLHWILAGVSVVTLVVISSLYPAWRATRLTPADAMRTYE